MARILLVGNDGENRAAAREAIHELSRHAVVEAGDGETALALLAGKGFDGGFDLVVLEVEVAGMNGFEVCRRMRVDARTESIPVVFVTATHRQGGSRLRGLDLGAADFIVLPVEKLELAARLGSVLRSKALADEVRRHNIELAEKVVERTRQLEELAGELRIERDAIRETFDVFEEALLLFDTAGQVQIGNTAGRKLIEPGEQGEEGTIRVDLSELAQQAIGTGAVANRSLSLTERRLDARAYPAAGRRALVYVRDVTEERDEEVRRLQSEKLASIGMLAAGVAHEINNPASFVLANIDALGALLRSLDERLRVDGQGTRHVGVKDLVFEAMTIVNESKEGMVRIHRIVRDLHSFSRVDDEPTALCDVNAAVESALSMLRNELRYRTAVERDLRATQRARVGAARLGQVLLNLVMNAAHALPEATLKRNRVQVRSYDEGAFVFVEVEDNGAGIPTDVMPRIFESFFTTKPAGVGTGLGLPISREIVRSVGGELVADSEPGRGARFRIMLPAATLTAATTGAGLAGGASEPRLTPIRMPAVPNRLRRRILAIDDEALLLRAYRRMLIEHHDIETRLGGPAALELFEQDRGFDIVLCDLQMPEMSGAELYGAVHARWPALADRFVFITGGAFSAEARRFLDEAPVSRIHKPFQVEELLELVESRASASGSSG